MNTQHIWTNIKGDLTAQGYYLENVASSEQKPLQRHQIFSLTNALGAMVLVEPKFVPYKHRVYWGWFNGKRCKSYSWCMNCGKNCTELPLNQQSWCEKCCN